MSNMNFNKQRLHDLEIWVPSDLFPIYIALNALSYTHFSLCNFFIISVYEDFSLGKSCYVLQTALVCKQI